MGNFDNVLNRNFVRGLPNSSSSDLSRTAISALEEIAERLNVLQQLGDRELLDTQRRQIEPALDAQLREIEQGRITAFLRNGGSPSDRRDVSCTMN